MNFETDNRLVLLEDLRAVGLRRCLVVYGGRIVVDHLALRYTLATVIRTREVIDMSNSSDDFPRRYEGKPAHQDQDRSDDAREIRQILCLDEVRHGSSAYDEAVELRDAILRRPLNLAISLHNLEAERSDYHLVGTDRVGRVRACLILTPDEKSQSIRMRQVAVDTSFQRNGHGAGLVRFSEQVAYNNGFATMVLHARDTAIPFYLRLGYDIIGDTFVEVGIPHHIMRRSLRPTP